MHRISRLRQTIALTGFLAVSLLCLPQSAESQVLSHEQIAAKAKATCAPFQGRKLSLVLSVKPGGGFDLAARALEPYLALHSGMSVHISHITGGQGKHPHHFSLASLTGLGILSTNHSVWLTRSTFNVFNTPYSTPLTCSSPSSPFIRLGIPGQLLNLKLKPVFGYQGSNESWLALLRGEVDITTMSDHSFMRNASTSTQAKDAMTLTAQAHPDFPDTPCLGGPGDLIDLKTQKLPPRNGNA